MKRLGVFCGSSPGTEPAYCAAATAVGRLVAARGDAIVYGGGHVGLMGALADAALAGGAEVTGVIPQWLVDREVAHRGVSHLHVVESMHDRRRLIYDLSDAFLVLPGGLGTFEELFEVLSWAQLGLLRRPCGVLNVEGYFDFLPKLIETGLRQALIGQAFREYALFVDADPEALLDRVWGAASTAPLAPEPARGS